MTQQTKAIVFTDPDHNINTCQIVVLTDEAGDPEKYIEHLRYLYDKGEYNHNPVNARVINYPDDVPVDRVFRNAWTDAQNTPTVDVCLERAKSIHMERIRLKRDEALKSSDKEFMLALSKGEEIKDIQEEKQILRDIPQGIEEAVSKAETLEELVCCWPEDLELHEAYQKDEK